MKKVELEIVALSHSITQSSNYAVLLGEVDGPRRLPIVIGGFEAQAIAVAMEQMVPSRPLTHDLIKNMFEAFSVELKEVVINNLQEGIFFSSLVCTMGGETIEIDSRTSDALALAVRFDCPIYTFEFVLEQASIVLPEQAEEEGSEEPRPKKRNGLESLDDEGLQQALQEALEKEDYEQAAKIRDEINRRK
jgi:bifunctional DNase/RNase